MYWTVNTEQARFWWMNKAWSTGRFASSQSLWHQLDRERRSHVATNITTAAATVSATNLRVASSSRLVLYEELDHQLYRHCDTIPYLLMTVLFKIGSSSTFLTNLFIYCLRKTCVGCRPYQKNEFGQHQRPTPRKIWIKSDWKNKTDQSHSEMEHFSDSVLIWIWSWPDRNWIRVRSGPDQDLTSARSGLNQDLIRVW